MNIPYIEGLGQRGYADLIEAEIANQYSKDAGFRPARSKRSVEDFSVYNDDGVTWYDVKSFDVDADFSMPNLISVERLRKILADPKQELVYITVYYSVDHDKKSVDVQKILEYNITEIDHSALAIQNLGLGILQIKDAKKELPKFDREFLGDTWTTKFDKMAYDFYGKQIAKFTELQEHYIDRNSV